MPKVDLFELFNGKSTFKVLSQYEAEYRVNDWVVAYRLQYYNINSKYEDARIGFSITGFSDYSEARENSVNEELLAETLKIFKEVKNESDSKLKGMRSQRK
ncbi:hypothetical protein DFH08DRAFT_800375 [Mycena albidolilacea]|uniref:Uncharacterized protein n=1 Tax=Mycena albidolilacea TaxID=1033008 RepID=A0AAD7AJW1_9AGAR|nr:hypothetical protein DFH08DRAFT_800375 [Mycena albidolilacea]